MALADGPLWSQWLISFNYDFMLLCDVRKMNDIHYYMWLSLNSIVIIGLGLVYLDVFSYSLLRFHINFFINTLFNRKVKFSK